MKSYMKVSMKSLHMYVHIDTKYEFIRFKFKEFLVINCAQL